VVVVVVLVDVVVVLVVVGAVVVVVVVGAVVVVVVVVVVTTQSPGWQVPGPMFTPPAAVQSSGVRSWQTSSMLGDVPVQQRIVSGAQPPGTHASQQLAKLLTCRSRYLIGHVAVRSSVSGSRSVSASAHAASIFSFASGRLSRKVCIGVFP